MSNIINLLGERDIAFTLKYFGVGDLATGISAKTVVDNFELISEHFSSKKDYNINSLDDYVDFLFIQNVVKIKEVIPYLKENQECVAKVCGFCSKENENYSTGNVIKYLNSNIQTIFDYEQTKRYFQIKDATIEFCSMCASGLHENVFKYLVNNEIYQLLHNYDLFQRTIEGNSELRSIFFQRITQRDVLHHAIKPVTNVVLALSNSRKKDSTILESSVEKIVNYGEQLVTELNEENIFYLESPIKTIAMFLAAIKNPKANDFKKHVDKAECLMNKYLEIFGHEFKYEIPLDEVKKLIESDKPWKDKVLCLTHHFDNRNKKMKADLNFAPETKSIVDLIATNIPTNDYFTVIHQQVLMMLIDCGGCIFFKIFSNEDNFIATMDAYGEIIYTISKALDCEEDDLTADFDFFSQMLHNYFYLDNSRKENEGKRALCYASVMFCCTLIEKILRTVYIAFKKNEMFIPNNKATIGNLLNDSNGVLRKILGEYHLRHLRFYLVTDPDGVGYNFRNRLAHWNDITPANLTNSLLCQLFYLMAGVIGSIYFFIIDETKKS